MPASVKPLVTRATCSTLTPFFLGHRPHGAEGLFHDAHQACVDFILGPEKAGEVLHPLEVTHGHAAGVGDYVGHDEGAALGEHVVGFGCGRSVGSFDDEAGGNPRGVRGGDQFPQTPANR
jgi:hypothetical protein